MDRLNPKPVEPLSLSQPSAYPSVSIRRGTTSDSVRLSQLTKRFFPYIHVSADHVFERIKNGIVYFVLEMKNKNEILGFIDFELNSEPNPRHATNEASPLQSPKTAKILGLCVVPEVQGHGWGKKLLAAALDEANALGCTQAVMLVEQSNEKAISIYEHAGFKKHGKLAQKLWDKDVLLFVKVF